MINVPLSKIALDSIKWLVENQVPESKTLEYKRDLQLDGREEKLEFLKDVSAFANADGGDLIFGIEEDPETKLPCSLPGIEVPVEDTYKLRIINLIRDSIRPRIANIQYLFLPICGLKKLLVIRIPKSYLSPHQVIMSGHDKFYTRHAGGKYPMDLEELRSAFLHTAELPRLIENYISDSLDQIRADRYGFFRSDMPIFVMHIIPYLSLTGSISIPISTVSDNFRKNSINAYCSSYTHCQIVVDGIYAKTEYEDKSYNTSTFIRNNGIIEIATTSMFFDHTNRPGKYIFYGELVDKTVQAFEKCLAFIRAYDNYDSITIPPPILVACSIIRGIGYSIKQERFVTGSFDRDPLRVQSLIIEDVLMDNLKDFLRPLFDSIWNASGYLKCPDEGYTKNQWS